VSQRPDLRGFASLRQRLPTQPKTAVLVLDAYGLLAALRDSTPAVLDVARFPADGKNGTASLSAQDCRAA
jgi:hypothetical protein